MLRPNREPTGSELRHERILRLDAAACDFAWDFDGIDWYPILRQSAWLTLDDAVKSKVYFRRLRKAALALTTMRRSLFQRRCASWTVADQISGALVEEGMSNADSVGLFCTARNLEHVDEEGTLTDRTFSPIGRRMSVKTERIRADDLTQISRFTFKFHRMHHTWITSFVERGAVAARKAHFSDGEIVRLQSHLRLGVAAAIGGLRLGRLWLENASWRFLITSPWYSPASMGLLAAFNERGLPTVDIQHGQQGPFQSMYVGWTTGDRPGTSMMPLSFWVWGSVTQSRISPKSRANSPSAHIIGYPYLWDTDVSSDLSVDSMQRPKVLVALQGAHIDLEDLIPAALRRFMHRNDAIFHLRPHPNQIIVPKVRKEIQDEFGSKVIFVDNRIPFPRVVQDYSLLMTGFSSSALEAATFRVPSVLWAPVAYEQFPDLISAGIFIVDAGLEVELREILGRKMSADWTVVDRYLSCNPNELDAAISGLLGRTQ